MKDAILYKQMESCNKLWLVLPRDLREEVLKLCHDNKPSGHLGEKKTYKKVSSKFYWYQMHESIRDYVAACTMCDKNKKRRQKDKAPMSKIPVASPMDCVATDCFGPLPESDKGNKYILLLTDLFTQWPQQKPVLSKS